jgi:hypothetical protein
VIEVHGDILDAWNRAWIIIPTNGYVKKNGEAVMGRGLALSAKKAYPSLPLELGRRLKEYGNIVFTFHEYRLITFPVKHNWWEKADYNLIRRSAEAVREIFSLNLTEIPTPVYIPKIGCGNGKLDWTYVKPILEKYLDDRFIVCDLV